MTDLLNNLRNSSPNESSYDLYCRCLDAATELRNAVIEECAKHIENRDEAFGNTFADEIRKLLTKDKP